MIKRFSEFVEESRLGRIMNNSFSDNVRQDEEEFMIKLDNGKSIYVKNDETRKQLNYLLNGRDDEDIEDQYVGNLQLKSGNEWLFMNYGIDLKYDPDGTGDNSFAKQNACDLLLNATPILKEEGDNLDEIIPSVKDIEELNNTCFIKPVLVGEYRIAEITHKESDISFHLRCDDVVDMTYVLLDENGKKILAELKLVPIGEFDRKSQEYKDAIDNGEFRIDYSRRRPYNTEEGWIQFRPIIKGIWQN